MRKAPIVSLSLLALLAVGITSSLSFVKENYKQVNATTTYRTFYLSTSETVCRAGVPDTTFDWCAIDENVKCSSVTPQNPYPGMVMSKIDDHLYACTLEGDPSDAYVEFTSVFNSNIVRAFQDGISPKWQYLSSNNFYSMTTYNRSSYDAEGNTWSVYSVSTALDFAKTFNAVVGDGTCSLNGNTNQDQLSAVWGEMNTLYTGLSDIEKGKLTSITLESSEALQDFASLYDYILTKPSYSGIYSDFAGRNPSLLGFKDINNNINNNSYSTLIAISVIGTVTLFAMPLYFVLRKRNKD